MRSLALLVPLVGCSAIFGLDGPQHIRGDAGGDSLASDVGPDMELDGFDPTKWHNIQPALPLSTTPDDDPSLTDDMLEMFFNRSQDIYVTMRAAVTDPWGTPTLVTDFSGNSTIETTPEITGNGLRLTLASSRSGTTGGTDLYYADRTTRTSPWSALSGFANLSSTSDDAMGTATPDDEEVVLSSNRPGGAGDYDIYWSHKNGGTFNSPTRLADLSGASADYSPHLTADKLEIYFDSFRTGGDDLYHSMRVGQTSWSAPMPITELNLPTGADADPWVSPDGKHMFFASDRGGAGMRIYEASR